MSVLFPLAQLTTDQLALIKQLLVFQEQKESKYSKDPPKLITFYQEQKQPDGGKVISLPLLFANSLLQMRPNDKLTHRAAPFSFQKPLRDYQIEPEQKAWAYLQRFGTVTLGLYPGFGKTALAAHLGARIGLLTVVLITLDPLITQWQKTFHNLTTARTWVVGEKQPESYEVIICMSQRWPKIEESIRKQVGVVVIDEAHLLCTPTQVSTLLAFQPRFVMSLSATLERDDENHRMVQAICGEHGIFRQSEKPFTVYKVLTGAVPERVTNRQKMLDWSHLVRTTLENEQRNQLILQLVRDNLNHKILILTSLKDHVMYLFDLLRANQVGCDYLCGTKKGYTDGTVLIGTASKIGTGFDQAAFCPEGEEVIHFDMLILACSMKKYTMLTQNIGRVFRSECPVVYHLVDDDSTIEKHWRKAAKWYRLRGGQIKQLEWVEGQLIGGC